LGRPVVQTQAPPDERRPRPRHAQRPPGDRRTLLPRLVAGLHRLSRTHGSPGGDPRRRRHRVDRPRAPTTTMTNVLYQRFVETAERYADRPALEVDGRTLSYRALADQALAVAATLSAHRTDEGSPLTCVLGQRSVHGFVGI